jgi:hypothetical protein
VIIAICLSVCVVARCPKADADLLSSPMAQDTTSSIRGPTPIGIALRYIALVAMPGVRPDTVWTFAAMRGLTDSIRVSESIYVFALPDTSRGSPNRATLASIIRSIRVGAPPWLSDAGMVVLFDNSRGPAVATDKFVAQFLPGVRATRIDSLNAAHHVRVLERNIRTPNHYLLEVTSRSTGDAITMANIYGHSGIVRYAHPDWIRLLRFYQYKPTDPLFVDQWYHENTGQRVPATAGNSGTPDADMDTPLAWSISRLVTGNSAVVLAIIDGGFDMNHPDLTGALWSNAADGSHGWDYTDCDRHPRENCGDNDPSPGWDQCPLLTQGDIHGTMVAGLAGAAFDNMKGIAGTCPNAQLMLLRIWSGIDEEHLTQAFQWARAEGAGIISNSWGYDDWEPRTNTLAEAIDAIVMPADGTQGTVVLFAMEELPSGSASCTVSDAGVLADGEHVIAVGAVSNLDQRPTNVACGSFLSVLAPSDHGEPSVGTLSIATTDMTNTDPSGSGKNCGYNDYNRLLLEPDCATALESDDPNYTYCFTGTSAATPLAAGVAGLVLTVAPTTSPDQLRSLVQDTADKVEDSVAKYGDQTGFSSPAPTTADPYAESTHGFGRINAFEAVRIAAPSSAGGKDGIDIFLRDNRLDWGNTEQLSNVLFEMSTDAAGVTTDRGYIPHWHSMDIKVDAPPYQMTDVPTALQFDGISDESPEAGADNRVYVRVRNRGYNDAADVHARLYWAYIGTAVPSLPSNFWSGFETNTLTETDWHFLGEEPSAGQAGVTVPYSGASAAKASRAPGSTISDDAKVLAFGWVAPSPDTGGPNHYCLLAIVDCPNDHPEAYEKFKSGATLGPEDFDIDELTPSDNDVTHRNYHVEDTSTGLSFVQHFFVRNTFPYKARFFIRPKLPPGWRAKIVWPRGPKPSGTNFTLGPGEQRLVDVVITAPKRRARGTVTIYQERVLEPRKDNTKEDRAARHSEIVGGFTIDFRPLRP